MRRSSWRRGFLRYGWAALRSGRLWNARTAARSRGSDNGGESQKEEQHVPGMPIDDSRDLDCVGVDHDKRVECGGDQEDRLRTIGEKTEGEGGTRGADEEGGAYERVEDTGGGTMTLEMLAN